ncbi:hypothetical protein BJ322DRAFT_1109564 [Thelephora terrestris]|uniref:Protein kinase domain-containing protein n=1 Tax=Thelephora terrestris TaxID=56493 RepID=A0A9P6HDX6_9AGAM|nr:hypothetical protein BJ322DRAFT_1109564 [Thelephora terrestris]
MSSIQKEALDLQGLCTTLKGPLGDRSLTLEQSNFDELKRPLIEVEGQLALWSTYGLFKRWIKGGTIKTGIGAFIGNINSITSASPVTSTNLVSNKPNVEGNQPPPVKRLDGEVTRQGDIPFAEGRYCEVWMGVWEKACGEGIGKEDTKKVALKALRTLKPPGRGDKAEKVERAERAERARKRLESELESWAELRHPNILPFYGTVRNIGNRLYMVGQHLTRENMGRFNFLRCFRGNLLVYAKGRSPEDKHHLLRGSAAGLNHLHLRGLVHGSVRCNNVLISQEGEPQICDFGLEKIACGDDYLENLALDRPPLVIRHAAPELIERNGSHITTYSDTYSFALLILECITEVHPFSDIPRDATVIHSRIGKKQSPNRPDGIPDDVWGLMNRCWDAEPELRPSMDESLTEPALEGRIVVAHDAIVALSSPRSVFWIPKQVTSLGYNANKAYYCVGLIPDTGLLSSHPATVLRTSRRLIAASWLHKTHDIVYPIVFLTAVFGSLNGDEGHPSVTPEIKPPITWLQFAATVCNEGEFRVEYQIPDATRRLTIYFGEVYLRTAFPSISHYPRPSPCTMFRPDNPRQPPNANADAKNSSNKNGKAVQGKVNPMTTLELRDHLEGLRDMSAVASRLFALIGEQITSVSYTIPLQRGSEAVKELGARAKVHKEGLKTAFDPLREQIAELKAGFWTKNRDALEGVVRKYVEQKLQDRVRAEVKKQLERYIKYLKDNEVNTGKLEEASKVSHARLQNSLLRIQYPNEPVAWIGSLPEGVELITFGQLINADENSVSILAKSLGLSPAPDDDHLGTLNVLMHHLGIGYKGIPSHTGLLMMPTKTNR